VYCLRRMNQLREKGIDCIKFDTKSGFSIIKLFLYSTIFRVSGRQFTIEINSSNPKVIFLLDALRLLRFSEFIDHNSSRRFIGKFGSTQLRSIARHCVNIKLVNESLFRNYQSAGISDFRKFSIFSPYIRPSDIEINEALMDYQAQLAPVVGGENRDVVLGSAWKATLHSDGTDLYGIISTLNLYSDLLPVYPTIKFVFMMGEIDESPLCAKALELATSLKLQHKNFFLITGGVPQWPILNSTIVLLRLTRTDGDSVSIREALDFGCKVIATDVCPRPPGVLIAPLDTPSQTKLMLTSLLGS
jgi:hypothetical protein